MPTVLIAGNHEYFGRAIDEALEAGRRSAAVNGIDFLDDEAITFDGTRIFGTTLWTDFRLFAGDDGAMRGHAMAYAGALLSDYEQIRPYVAKSERWTPVMSSAQHMSSRAALEAELATSTQPVVVVSHHAPHTKSIAPEFTTDLLTPGFVSDLAQVIERYRPPLWIHGHTHRSFDYRVGATRVVCNPLGYRHEQTGFDPVKILEV
jgi:predicted phosphohydrolase